ncbi:tetratricopeptide repeat protein [Natronoflexus pectinivorans]|nr:tetratricopeptide repeat protein [Natronoflexus pectinivorans]
MKILSITICIFLMTALFPFWGIAGTLGIQKGSYDDLQSRIYESIEHQTGNTRELISEFKRLGGFDADLLLGMAYYFKAELNYSEAAWNEAIENYSAAIRYFDSLNETGRLAITYNNLGLVYSFIGEYDNSLDAYSKALALELDMGDQTAIAETYQNMANVFSAGENYDKALEFHQKALDVFLQERNDIRIAATYNNLATIFARTQKYDEASQNYLNALSTYRKLGMEHEESIVLCNIGSLKTREGSYNEAVIYLERALVILKARVDRIGEARAYSLLADTYAKRNDHQHAIFLHRKALNIATTYNLNDVYIDSKFSLYTTHKNAGNWEKALAAYENYIKSRDQLLKENPAFAGGVLDKELEHRIIERDRMLQRAQLRERILFGLFVFVGVLAFLAFIIATYRRRIIRSQNEYEKVRSKLLKEKFNATAVIDYLNSIRDEMIKGDNQNAVSQLDGFSNMMQIMMENSCQQFISLRKEIEFLRSFLDFQKERYNCDIECNIESNVIHNADQVMVPSMLTQSFIEHAFVNSDCAETKPTLNFAFMRRGNVLDVIIENNLNSSAESAILEERHRNLGISMVHHKSSGYKMHRLLNHLGPLHTEVRTVGGREAGHRVRFSLPFMVN